VRVPLPPGTYALGPENGTLSVRTGRTGAAAKAGHNLLIHVTSWSATFEAAEDPARARITLEADPTSLRVREGTGGMQSLDDDDKAGIETTIDEEVLERRAIAFHSTSIAAADGGLHVHGELTLGGTTKPIELDLAVGDDGALGGSVVVKQSDWGIAPYSTLFGTLKVVDEVEVSLDAHPA
jgi:polyisoprenoid-binding protein YceI